MSAIIFLARHGAHADVERALSGRSDIALSRLGHEQAAKLAKLCAVRCVRTIHSSPRPRTLQTAEIVAGRIGADLAIVEALDEIDFGSWTGRSFDNLDGDPLWTRWNRRRSSVCPPGGETMAAATTRIAGHIDALAASGQSHVLCVSHCDLIRGAIAHYLGLGLDHLLRFDVDPASLSTLNVGPWGARLMCLNEIPQ